jgi:hypothetical protein
VSYLFGGHWWSLVVIGGHWWSLVVIGGHWWSLVVIGGHLVKLKFEINAGITTINARSANNKK